ncbi:DUF427 domain-containing protein [Nocardioides acrostichi]|uniref:DUF427 domain-containing protein n=1 Tax=Nocardioides acrostichi TaxID=2784339 RepID=A0A930UXV7_9ACTN|nr:DUF427 domain-containing protein [Nocardioides acrostichi]MBF4161065.1 DUF427 domain-containing protein [Nocardioides acrostichi]
MRRPRPIAPGPGQESVWDYPRPPRLERTDERIEIVLGGTSIATTSDGWRVLETSHPPTYYLPSSAFAPGVLRPTFGSSHCEWKGAASYFDLAAAEDGPVLAERAAWTYPDPTPAFADLAGAVSVMPAAVEAAYVDGERVRPQEGGFYGGWITDRVVGPFKGVPGSWGW